MTGIDTVLTENLDNWTSAIERKNGAGRGRSKKVSFYGIEKLRALILDLAVRGKLVPQDPKDEPASDLLTRISLEKQRLYKKGATKKPAALREIDASSLPFPVPSSWKWVHLSDILTKLTDGTHHSPPNGQNGEFLYVTAKNIKKCGVSLQDATYVTTQVHQEIYSRCNPEKGDILYIKDGATTGVATINNLEEPFSMLSSVALLKLPSCLYNRLIVEFLRSPFFYDQMRSSMKGAAITRVTLKRMGPSFFPLPPLAEQHRIVGKVDQLMALCDTLEAETSDAVEAHQVLVDQLLATLTDSQDAKELARNWALIEEHFDILFTTEDSVDQLKQTILQLAVMGKLVPQAPNDEPASELLKRIQHEKSELIAAGKIKKSKPLHPVQVSEMSIDLPEGWAWCRLGELLLTSEAGWSPQCDPHPKDESNWGVLKVSAVSWNEFKPNENKQLPENMDPRPELEVKSGDFLISRANTAELVARSIVVPSVIPARLMLSDKIIRIKFSALVSIEYINLFNSSKFSRNYYAATAGGTSSSMKNVSRAQIANLGVPLPPLSEQKRIVENFKRLEALCEVLDNHLKHSNFQRLKFADIVVGNAVA